MSEQIAKLLTEKRLNIIRGKALVGAATRQEIASVFGHIDAMEARLDRADDDDTFGTEGWRHWMDMP